MAYGVILKHLEVDKITWGESGAGHPFFNWRGEHWRGLDEVSFQIRSMELGQHKSVSLNLIWDNANVEAR
jgi:hypothetical protein